MKVWKDKEGNWLNPSEFVARFKEGVAKVTPLQQTKSQLIFTWITVIGILCGMVATVFAIKTLWWLEIILLAALGNTLVGIIGVYQKYKTLKEMDSMIMEQTMEVQKENGL